ncbi:cell division coordinator CpoB [Rubritalea halochordaticola]|uniref:Cell division coordinator CpoB n=1 Tax=Rubritalea halochordaticola TaxID=714537 RepID=A0ABP9UYV6_9BACT
MRHLTLITLALASPITVSAQEPARALQADPANDYFARAQQLYETGRTAARPEDKAEFFQKAIPVLRDYIQRFPRHENTQAAYYYLADAYYETQQQDRAIPIFELIVRQYQKGRFVSAAAYRLAYANYSKKDFRNAARLFGITALNASQPEDQIRAAYFQAQCYILLEQNERALPILKDISKAETKSPYKDQAIMKIGHILLANKQYEDALASFQKLLAGEQPAPLKAEASFHAGLAAAALNMSKLAESLFQGTLSAKDSVWIPQAHIALLNLYYKNENYDALIKQAEQSNVELEPKMIAKQGVMVGRAFLRKKNYPKAVDYFLEIEQAVPGTDMAFEAGYFKLLSFFNMKGSRIVDQVDHFIQNYAVGRGTHKYIHQALFMKAETQYAAKNYKEAAKTYNSIDPKLIDELNLPSFLYKKAWCLAETDNHAGAAKSFSEFIDLDPDDPRTITAYAMRGESFLELDDRVNALRDFDMVIQKSPNTKLAAMALQNSAKIQRQAKQYQDMINRLSTLLKDYKDLPNQTIANANYWIGWGYYKLEQYAEAPPYLDKAIQLDKQSYGKQAVMLSILCHYSLKDLANLTKSVETADEIGLYDKVPLPVFRWLGSQYYNSGDFEKAASYLESGLEKGVPQKTPAIIWRLLTKSQLQSGNLEDALDSANKLLSIEKEDAYIVDAKLDKTNILLGLQRYGDAKMIGDEALQMRPTGKVKAGLLMAMGDISFQTNDFNEASKHYVLLVSNFENLDLHAEALYKLSQALDKAGKSKEASEYKKQLQQKYPNYKPAS